ncbi:hypothetical protein EMCRGX_G024665 [Ephydatia muelleri]
MPHRTVSTSHTYHTPRSSCHPDDPALFDCSTATCQVPGVSGGDVYVPMVHLALAHKLLYSDPDYVYIHSAMSSISDNQSSAHLHLTTFSSPFHPLPVAYVCAAVPPEVPVAIRGVPPG